MDARQMTCPTLPSRLFLTLAALFMPAGNALASAQDDAAELPRVLARLRQLEDAEQREIADRVLFSALPVEIIPLAQARKAMQWALSDECQRATSEFATLYPAEVYAPALKLRQNSAKIGSSRWNKISKGNFDAELFRARPLRWRWSYGRNRLWIPKQAMAPEKVIEALWQGRLPQPSLLQAAVEGLLDQDAAMDKIAAYFEHGYRDRDGYVYPQVLLDDIWNSGQTFGISDVETVAYLRLIEGDQSISSPIAKSRHLGLYQRIKDKFIPYRDYRNLRWALAARLLDAGSPLPAVLSGKTKLLDTAWALVDHDPVRMALWLRNQPQRDSFLLEVHELALKPPCGKEELERRLQVRTTTSAWIAYATRQALRDEGLSFSR